jgi:peptidoglycan/LPS O-acetylase OafA/YrhL
MDVQSATASRATGSRSHLATLDGLRGVAVALVMITHLPAEPAAQIHRLIPQLMHMGGYLGVDLFFVLSGFLITRILLADRVSGAPLKYFLIRRCLRIFPLYYLVLLLNAAFSPSVALVWCAVYLSNYYFAFVADENLLRHTWSLCVEEHFYLFWPVLARYLPTRLSYRLLFLVMAISLGSSCALALTRVPHAATLIYGGTLSRVWSLALGGLVAYSRFGAEGRPPAWRAALPLGVGSASVLVAVVLAASGRTALAYLVMVPAYSFISLAALLLALATASSATVVGRGLRARPLRFTGRISYGLYLFHPFAYHLFLARHGERLSVGLIARAGLGVLLAFAVAAISFKYFESYFLKMKSKFVPRGSPAPDPALAGV